MASAQSKRQKLATATSAAATETSNHEYKETSLVLSGSEDTTSGNTTSGNNNTNNTNNNSSTTKSKSTSSHNSQSGAETGGNTFGLGDVDDLSDDSDSDDDDEEDDDELDDDPLGADKLLGGFQHQHHQQHHHTGGQNHLDIQEQLAAAGPAGVAAAAAIATARKRKRPHSFETNPSVRKRQQTRLIRKLRACIDEYTMRVGQQAVVLITMPGKAVHNFKVFGAQPLESVIRTCKQEIMGELEQALLEQAPAQFKEDANKHELPPLVIDGIPTPVEKMTQAQLRAFIPLMLKYSTGRGKPGWGKDTTRPPWWPETLPWANVRSDARDENEKQRISWTTTLRQIVTNCYKYHGRDDLLPTFDENEESLKQQREQQQQLQEQQEQQLLGGNGNGAGRAEQRRSGGEQQGRFHLRSASQKQQQQQQQPVASLAAETQVVYSAAPAYATNIVHTISNSDGTISLIQVDPANAQIFTLPDGTQMRAVRVQTLGAESLCGQQIGELHEAGQLELSGLAGPTDAGSGVASDRQQQQAQSQQQQQQGQQQAIALSEASLGADGQIIVTGEDGTQSCYPMSSLVSIPASMYQQFSGGQQLSIVTADGTSIPANAVSIHAIQDHQELADLQQQQQEQQVSLVVEQPGGGQTEPESGAQDSKQSLVGAGQEQAAGKTQSAKQAAKEEQQTASS